MLILALGLATGELQAAFAIRVWAKKAHGGLTVRGARRPLSHFNSIALLWSCKLSMFFPPSLIREWRTSKLTELFLPLSHANLQVLFISMYLISLGIPCADVRY